MNKIITISREFSSGGREVGKRLADKLHFSYYDKEIVAEIAKDSGLSEQFIKKYTENEITRNYPITIGRSFGMIDYYQSPSDSIFIKQSKIIRKLSEKGNCIIVGRCADYILREQNPIKIFIYSSNMNDRIERCKLKRPDKELLSERELKKMIIEIDKHRSKYYEFYTYQDWKDMTYHDLCINTSTFSIKKAVDIIASFVSDIII